MTGIKSLVILAAAGCVGLTFLVLGCALEPFGVYWPLFVLIFYVLSPLPLLITSRWQEGMGSETSAVHEFAYFLTTGIVVSAFALPIVLWVANALNNGIWAMLLVQTGNVFTFGTIAAYFYMTRESDGYGNNLF